MNSQKINATFVLSVSFGTFEDYNKFRVVWFLYQQFVRHNNIWFQAEFLLDHKRNYVHQLGKFIMNIISVQDVTDRKPEYIYPYSLLCSENYLVIVKKKGNIFLTLFYFNQVR